MRARRRPTEQRAADRRRSPRPAARPRPRTPPRVPAATSRCTSPTSTVGVGEVQRAVGPPHHAGRVVLPVAARAEVVAGPEDRLRSAQHDGQPDDEHGGRPTPDVSSHVTPPAADGDRAHPRVRHRQDGRGVDLVRLRRHRGQQGAQPRDRHAQHLAGLELLEAGRTAQRLGDEASAAGGLPAPTPTACVDGEHRRPQHHVGVGRPATSRHSERSDPRAAAAVSSASARSRPSSSSPRTTAAPRAAAYASKSRSPLIRPWWPASLTRATVPG